MAFTIDWDNSQLRKNIDKMATKAGVVVLMYANTKAGQLESLMKQRRPWTDRTNMAKQMLSVRVSQPNENTIRMTLAHGVNYGIWLELAHEKNYAIVGPTIRQEGPKFVSELNGLMSKLKL